MISATRWSDGDDEALPTGESLYYRLHHPAVPLDEAHAVSAPMHANLAPSRGFSSFADPHSLWIYLHEMDWVSVPDEVDFGERVVVVFRGDEVGRGIDHEPLVIPLDAPVLTLAWLEFERRLRSTPQPEALWRRDLAAVASRSVNTRPSAGEILVWTSPAHGSRPPPAKQNPSDRNPDQRLHRRHA